jgi:hypothetical protein
MDSFIFYGDYEQLIQKDNLSQAINGRKRLLDKIQSAAITEMKGYLDCKYDTSIALQPILAWDETKIYNAGQNVYIDSLPYSPTSLYNIGSYCIQNENIYKCNTAITILEAFNISHWTFICEIYTVFNAIFPHPTFDINGIYNVGDQIIHLNKTYTCKIATYVMNHYDQLQNGNANVNMIQNVYPTDTKKGVTYWGVGTAYIITESTDILNTNFWSQGDTRDQKLIQVAVDIVLYNAHCRIAPQNVPTLRINRYMGDVSSRQTGGQRITFPSTSALGWLQECQNADGITPNIPLLPTVASSQQGEIRFGGRTKLVNNW